MSLPCDFRRASLAAVLSGLTTLILISAFAPLPAAAESHAATEPDAERLKEADRAFAIRTAEQGAAGWASYFLADGVMFPDTGRIKGREAIEAYMSQAMGPGLPLLRWEPAEAVIADSGEMGWTLGRWEMVNQPGTLEETIVARGNYVTLWQKDENGEWKVAADIGNDDPQKNP